MPINTEDNNDKDVLVNTSFIKRFKKCLDRKIFLETDTIEKNCLRHGIQIQVFLAKKSNVVVYVSPFWKISVFKKFIVEKLKIDESVDFVRFFFRFQEIKHNNMYLYNYGIRKNSRIFVSVNRIILKRQKLRTKSNSPVLIEHFGCVPRTSKSYKLIKNVLRGLRNYAPELTLDGTGGTYYMKDRHQKYCAIFKPVDEEAYAPNNPRVYRSEIGSKTFRPGLHSGGGASREVAAFLLDHEGFSGVPFTTMVEITNCKGFYKKEMDSKRGAMCSKPIERKLESKIGSLQKVVKHIDTTSNYGVNLFALDEVHKVGILDIRLLNLDRNEQNILVNRRPGQPKVDFIPIDHGYCLPNCLAVDWYDWIWLSWSQARKPFTKRSLEHIESIDISKDVRTLRDLGIEEESIILFKIANILLKKSARAGLNLYQIASFYLRKEKSTPSNLETIVIMAIVLTFHLKNVKKNTMSSYSVEDSYIPSLNIEKLRSISLKELKKSPTLHLNPKRRINSSKHFKENNPVSKNTKQNTKTKKKIKVNPSQKRSYSRSLSGMNFQKSKNCFSDDCFIEVKNMIIQKGIRIRDDLHLEIPKEFEMYKWRSDYNEIICRSEFLKNASCLMDYLVHNMVLKTRQELCKEGLKEKSKFRKSV